MGAMMRGLRWMIRLAVFGLVLAGAALWLTKPQTLPQGALEGMQADVQNGEIVFTAAGCASCHKAPKGERLILSGGQAFASPFGTFYAPNISSHPTAGIGDWGLADFANALRYGTSPRGQHYYPAFPYDSYSHMTDQDLVDLWGYIQTLPADPAPSRAHDLGFPFSIRAGLGLWKALYLRDDWAGPAAAGADADWLRGRYLTQALAHCSACHTPRGPLGGPQNDAYLQGAPHLSGKGRIPAINRSQLGWSAPDIAEYLSSGFTPEYDSAGGDMVDVIENTSRLPQSDRDAIARYIHSID